MAYYERDYYRQVTSFGGFGQMWRRSATAWLILLNVAIFFLDALLAQMGWHDAWGMGPLMHWGAFSYATAVGHFEVWRFVTYPFLHGGFGHLFWNMLTLFFFGPMVEGYLGSRRFVGFYMLSAIGGALLYLVLLGLGHAAGPDVHLPFLLIDSTATVLIGASAAILGVLVACLKIAPTSQVLLMFILPVPMWLIVIAALLGETYFAMMGQGASVAHLGGAMVGGVLIWRVGLLGFADRVSLGRLGPGRFIEKYRKAAWQRAVRREQQFDREIDRILEKVAREGLHSLTRQEKRMLQRATERQRQS